MIDLSDGLATDAGHLARAAACSSRLRLADVPVRRRGGARSRPATGGDDYELLFTIAPSGAPRPRRRPT